MQTALAESLAELSHETQKMWDEIARVFVSTRAQLGGIRIDFRAKGLGEISLSYLNRAFTLILMTAC